MMHEKCDYLAEITYERCEFPCRVIVHDYEALAEVYKMNKRSLVLVLLCLLLASFASAESELACDHQWVPYNEEQHGILPEEITLRQEDEVYHVCSRWYPDEVCTLCGERRGGSAVGSWMYHAYTVSHWERTEAADTAQVTLTCGVCQYVYTYDLTL